MVQQKVASFSEGFPTIILFIGITSGDPGDDLPDTLSSPPNDQEFLYERVEGMEVKPTVYALTNYVGLDGSIEKTSQDQSTPTRDNVRRTMVEISEKLKPEDKVLVHFAGHASRDTTDTPYLELLDGRASQEDLMSWFIEKAPRDTIFIFVLDACYIGNFFHLPFVCENGKDLIRRSEGVDNIYAGDHRILVFTGAGAQAAAPGVTVTQVNGETKRHGAFAWCLLSILRDWNGVQVETLDFLAKLYSKYRDLPLPKDTGETRDTRMVPPKDTAQQRNLYVSSSQHLPLTLVII